VHNTFEKVVRGFASRLRLAVTSDVLGKLRQLYRWQWLNRAQTYALQQDRLRHLLLHAYHHVPYYREVLTSAGVANDSGTVNLKYFEQIPLLDKVTIRAHFRDLKSDDLAARKWYRNTSGGSTGEPVMLIQDRNFSDWTKAISILNDIWAGYASSARKIRLWGSERDLLIGKETLKSRFIRWTNNEVWLNAFRMTPAQMHGYVEKINAFKPVQILAYAENVYELSRFIQREGLQVYSPGSIMTSAGTLLPHMRESIEQVFKAPVFNRYGSREVGAIACECDHHSGLHVASVTNYVEVIMPDGRQANPGEVGEIVITPLTNYAMPLIRYRIEDMGMWSQASCSCGRGWPLLKEVVGRRTDFFIGKNGQSIDGRVFNTFLWNKPFVEKYQIIQEDNDYIRLLILPRELVTNPNDVYAKEMNGITKKICSVMGNDCRVEYQFVRSIKPTESGKYCYTFSKLAK